MKQPLYPRDILKIHSSDIIKNNYSLDINIDNARKNKEVKEESINNPLKKVIRIATDKDTKSYNEYKT